MALRALKMPQETARIRQVLGCSATARKKCTPSRAPADRFRGTPKEIKKNLKGVDNH